MNSPGNTAALLKALIIYAICVPVAVFVGYVLTNPLNFSTFNILGIMALVLFSPILLRWHYPFLLFSLQVGITLFFIKGNPTLGLAMTALSLGISVLERAMNRNRHFIRVPEITWPLICMGGVFLFTAKLTGGIGLHVLGSSVYGGLKYIYLGLGILVYFALSAKQIPPEKIRFYMVVFFSGGLLSFIPDLFSIAPHWTAPIFWFFRPGADSSLGFGETRLGGFSASGVSLYCLVMALYGVRGIFFARKPWRLFLFVLSLLLIFLGGFRGQFFTVALIFGVMFFLEGLHRTRMLPLFIFIGLLGFAILIPTASKLPFTFQRTIAFLPLHLDSQARDSAQGTLNWRIQMWTALLPQVPKYLLLGKGLGISPEDYLMIMGAGAPLAGSGQFDASQDPLALSYDYHNGPLSILIPFGIWGALAFGWLMVISIRVLHDNYRYCDPELRSINLYLFASFISILVAFLFVGGGFSSDLMRFTAVLGLSVAINGGRCRPVAAQPVPMTLPARSASRLAGLQPAFPK